MTTAGEFFSSCGVARRWKASAAAVGIVLLWTLVACRRLGLPGLQYDEVLFAAWLYPGKQASATWIERLMLMPYMGALKPWLYALWLPLAGHGAWAVRLPMILLSAVTLGLIYRVLRRVVEPGLALALLALAAGDALYLFTSRYDWGPVVLQRLCFWGALAILTGGASARRAFFAGLLCGLGLFDKLSFHWLLVAGAATALIFYPRQLRERLHVSGFAGFIVGSLPLWLYRGAGFGQGAVDLEGDWSPIQAKLSLVRNALAGRPLNGWIAHSYLEPEIQEDFQPPGWLAFAERWAGDWLLLLAAVAFLAMAVLLMRGDAKARFAAAGALFCALAGTQMFVLNGAGYLHHWALAAPVPQLAIGLAGAALWERRMGRPWLVLAFVSMLAVQALALARQYKEIVDYGGRPSWSEAIHPLADHLLAGKPEHVVILDWGIETQLLLLSGGELPTRSVFGDADITHWLEQPGDRVFVAYESGVPDLFPGAAKDLERLAAALGLELEKFAPIEDRQGRPIYRIWRVRRP